MKVTIAFLILLSAFNARLAGQNAHLTQNKEIYKVYETNEPTKNKKKNGVLVLFADNTFINYGEGESSCWYTSGRWLGNNQIFMCRTYNEIQDTVQLVNDIKKIFIPKQKYFTLPEKTPFVKISYRDYIFEIRKANLYDKIKDIYYYP